MSLFVDVKAAFDLVDSEVLVRTLRKRGVREDLVERIEEVMRKTKSRIKIGGNEGEGEKLMKKVQRKRGRMETVEGLERAEGERREREGGVA